MGQVIEFIDIKTLLSLRTMFYFDNYAAGFRSEFSFYTVQI